LTEYREVNIESIRVSLTSQQRILLLRAQGDDRLLPIWIGPYETEAITISLQEIEVARPQTHDLLLNSLKELKHRLIRVEIVAIKGEVFYGSLVIDSGDGERSIDARPSDAIALAVRGHVPILVSSQVLNEAGILPDEDITEMVMSGQTGGEKKANTTPVEEEDSSQRLSLFEDFLKNVDNDDSTADGRAADDKPDPDES
jgi:uncharacterized protein